MKRMQSANLQNFCSDNGVQLKSKAKKKVFPSFFGDISTSSIKKGTREKVRQPRTKSRRKGNMKGKRYILEKKILLLSNKTKKRKKSASTIFIQSTHNNTIYTVCHVGGITNCTVSTGMCGFKNTRKSTSYAAQMAAEKLASLTKKKKTFGVKINGLGAGKLSGVRALHQFGFRITNVQECTGLAHNGCRAPKSRRL